MHGRHGAGKVVLRAAPQGTGIIAGGPMRAVFETVGMQDVVAKSLGSSNPYNLVRATFDALKNEDSPAGCRRPPRPEGVDAAGSPPRCRATATPPAPRLKGGLAIMAKKSAEASAKKTVTVEQIGSPIRREAKQRQTLIGLKLNKLHRHCDPGGHARRPRHDREGQAPRARPNVGRAVRRAS